MRADILSRLVRMARASCRADAAALVVFEQPRPVCLAVEGFAPADLSQGAVSRLRDLVLDGPIAADAMPAHVETESQTPYRAAVPLRAPGGRAYGAIMVGCRTMRTPTPECRTRLRDVVDIASALLAAWASEPHASLEPQASPPPLAASSAATLLAPPQSSLRPPPPVYAGEAQRDALGVPEDSVWQLDADYRFTHAATMSGKVADALIGVRVQDAFAFDANDPSWIAHLAELGARRPYRDHILTIEVAGQTRTISSSGYPVYDADGVFEGYRGMARDITDTVEQPGASGAATIDPVTSLMNRTGWYGALDRLMPGTQSHTARGALLLIDIDGFASLNERLGQETGNAILRQVARRIEAEIRVHDRLARVGSDEFAILAGDVSRPQDVEDLAERIQMAFLTPIEVGETLIEITITTGLALAPDDGDSADALISSAALALLAAKRQARGSHRFYSSRMRKDAQDRRQLESDLRMAVEGHEFELFYQPQLDLGTGRIVGAEALLRWRHPTRGLVPPGLFIDALESGPYATSVGNWVLQEGCRQARAWQEGGHAVRVGMNMSVAHFRSDGVVALLAETLATLDLSPALVEMEVTENVVFESGEDGARIIKALRELGVGVAFDDFGTGYGSLADLRRISVDRIKIDRSFIMDSLSSPRDATIVKAIVSLAKTLDLAVIAEGVEEVEQEALLRGFGCHEVQGYLYAKPMPASAFTDLLRQEARERGGETTACANTPDDAADASRDAGASMSDEDAARAA